jgi:hypothetical protein
VSVDVGNSDRTFPVGGNTPYVNIVRVENIAGSVGDNADGRMRMESRGRQCRGQEAEEYSGFVQASSMLQLPRWCRGGRSRAAVRRHPPRLTEAVFSPSPRETRSWLTASRGLSNPRPDVPKPGGVVSTMKDTERPVLTQLTDVAHGHTGSFGVSVRASPLPVALQYPEAETIHLVMDNLNSHRRKSLTDLYGAEIGGEI